MEKLKTFATNHPVYFGLLTIVAYFLIGAVFVGLATLLSGLPYSDERVQSFGALASILILLVVAWRFFWLRPMGVANLGKWWVWLIALALLIYVVLGYWLVFFGEVSLDLSVISKSEEARTVFWRQFVVGLTEEILFRGIILYTLIRVWGGTRSGLYLAVIVSALFFGIPHILQGVAGQPLNLALLVIGEAIISGIWYAVYVLLAETLWPIVLIHAFSNMAVGLMAITEPGWSLSGSGMVGAILIQLPLLLLGLWLLQRRGPGLTVPNIP